MLPILRIIPVGGVFFAIAIVVLALSPPSGTRTVLSPHVMSARGPLMQLDEHPEWRQFLIQAAARRAEELGKLRELPDAGRTKVAGLPLERPDADPDDETGSITVMPTATIPVDIGETSSTELPVTLPEERPPVMKTPERLKLPNESRRRGGYHASRIKTTAKPEPAATFNIFEILFGALQANPQKAGAPPVRPTSARAER
jgi:hypothetical protein